MAKSNNEDDGGWDDLERWANETDETDSSNASKPLSASEQVALIEKSTPKVRTFWRGSVKLICDAAAECARTAKRLDAEHKKLYVKKLRCGNTVFNMLKRIGEDVSARPRSRKTMSFLRTRSFSRTTSRTIPNRLQRATTSMTRW